MTDDVDFRPQRRRLLQAIPAATAAAGSVAAGTARAAAAKPAANPMSAPAIIPVPPQAPMKEGLAKLRDVDLYWWDTGGSGPAVVMLHPRTGSGLVWAYQQPALVKAGYRVISYSRRGFHGSGTGPEDRPGTGAGDLRQLLDVLKVDRFHAVSSAAGAFVALDFALSSPERLLSLVLACTILGVHDPALDGLIHNLDVSGFSAMPAYFRELGPTYRAMNPKGTALWRELEAQALVGKTYSQPFENPMVVESLALLKPRTLLISGAADLIAPPPMARLFAGLIPNCRLEIFPECGHSAYWERPDLFNAAVIDFIRR